MRATALLALFLLFSCVTVDQPPRNASADEQLDAILGSYVIGFLRFNPTSSTYVGGVGLEPSLEQADARLRDYSPATLDREARWLSQVIALLHSIDPSALSASRRIDRDFAIAQIQFMLRQTHLRNYQQRSVDSYTDEPFRAVDFQLQGMTGTGASSYGTSEEWDRVIARLNAIPPYLRNARLQLAAGIEAKNTADFRMLYRNGIVASNSNAKYFEETLPGIAEERITGPRKSGQLAELRSAGALAAAASRDFSSYIASTFFDDPSKETGIKPQFGGDRFAMGETEYDWALENNLRAGQSAAQLYESSWSIVVDTQRQMRELARTIANQNGWPLTDDDTLVRAVLDKLGDDHPKNDAEMIAWYREAGGRLVDYARRTGLFDVPADYKLDVIETPAPLLASTDGAAYYPAPAFKKTGVGRFYVSPTGNDVSMLRENNRSAVADLAAHEGFPGHDWYYKVLAAASASPVRWLNAGSIEDSSSMWADSMASEGWALYSEAILAEPQPGAPNGFYTPAERLYQLQGKLYRDLRVRIDTGIHTGRMTYDDAVDLYSQVVDFQPGSCRAASLLDMKRASCKSAERAIFRYSKWPTQAITYRLGKDAIFNLRRRASEQLGATFDLKKFHLAVIRQGTIPPGYFGEAVLQELTSR